MRACDPLGWARLTRIGHVMQAFPVLTYLDTKPLVAKPQHRYLSSTIALATVSMDSQRAAYSPAAVGM
jgi:hypothetical protein